MYEIVCRGPREVGVGDDGRFLTHSCERLPSTRARWTRATRRAASRSWPRWTRAYTRRVHPTHPFDVIGWRGDYLPYRFAVEDVRPLMADRSHVPPSGHTVFKLPGCYLCVFTVRSVEKEGMWLPFFHRNLDYLRDARLPFRRLFQRRRRGGLGHGHRCIRWGCLTGRSRARSRPSWTAARPRVHNEVAVMADFANPTRVSEFALGLSEPRLHGRVGRLRDGRPLHLPRRDAWRRCGRWVSAWPTSATRCGRRRTRGGRDAGARAALAFDLRALRDEFYEDPYGRTTGCAAGTGAPVPGRLVLPDALRRRGLRVPGPPAFLQSDKRVEFAPKFGDSALYEHHTTSVVFRDGRDHTRIRRLFSPGLHPPCAGRAGA